MKIERAVREKTFTLTSIAGPSGSGKTYSALLYARGLVGPEGKVGFIDTENKRSRFYADVAGGFDVIDLDPPFTSARYIEAIKAFQAAGYTAIVVDSISHEWEGSGGVLEQAEAIEERTKRAGLHCWQKPKAAHKKLMNELLQTRAHLIFCCRVKEKVTQVKGRDGKAEIINEGYVVVQEKSFIYEMTVSMMLEEGTHVPLLQKCPGDLYPAFPQGERLTPKNGAAVREWADKGEAIDEAFEECKREGVLTASKGVSALMEWWKALGRDRQTKMEKIKDTLKSIAMAHDQMVQDQIDAGGGDISERLNHARNKSEKTAGENEGFDPDYVKRETESVLTGEIVPDEPHDPDTGELSPHNEASDPATSPAAPDDDGTLQPDAPPSSEVPSEEPAGGFASEPAGSAEPDMFGKFNFAPGEIQHLKDFARKSLNEASGDSDAPAKVQFLERMFLDYLDAVITSEAKDALRAMGVPTHAVIDGKRTRQQAANYIATELLGCDPSELEGRK